MMQQSESVGILTSGVSRRLIHRLIEEPGIRIIVEDRATGKVLESNAVCHYESVAELVSGVRDTYDPKVREQTAVVFRNLSTVLRASEWTNAGVSLWDVVSGVFLWQYLDSLFQATDTARQLLNLTRPMRVVLSGLNTPLARAMAAVAQVEGLRVEVLENETATMRLIFQARVLPYLGHMRECVRGAWHRLWRIRKCDAPFVLVNHAPRNLLVMLPVLNALTNKISQERILLVQMGSEGLEEVLQTGFPYREFDCYASLGKGLRALWSIAHIVEFLTSGRWKEPVSRAGIEWEGVPLAILADQEISFGLARLLGYTVREVACARMMLRRESPAIVFLTDDRASYGRAVGLAARTLGIPSLLVQWGPIGWNSAWLPGMAADVVAVEGERAAEVIRACDNGQQLRVVVTGQPKYDLLLNQAIRASKSAICMKHGLDPKSPILLYASPPVSERSAMLKRNTVEERNLTSEVEAVCRATRGMTWVQLIVKPHPNERTLVHQQILDEIGGPNIHLLSKEETIYPFLFVCDLVITHHSTVGLEGVLLEKPVVIVNLTGRPDSFPYVESGVALGAYSAAEVGPAIHAALYDAQARRRMAESRPSFLLRYASRDGAPATDRMVNLALDLAQSRFPHDEGF
jgi:hypothetical protein